MTVIISEWVKLAKKGPNTWNGFMRRHMGEAWWQSLQHKIPASHQHLYGSISATQAMPESDYHQTCEDLQINEKPNIIQLSGLINYDDISGLVFPHQCEIKDQGVKGQRHVTANFSNCIFCEKLSCDKNASLRHVFFDGSAILGKAEFNNIQSGDVSFTDCVFKKRFEFKNSNNAELIHFDNATFLSWTVFENSTFRDVATFRSTQFHGDALFERTEFKQANFIGATFKSILSLQGAKFEFAPKFEGVQCDAILFDDHTEFRNNSSSLQEDASAWAALIRLMERVHNLPQRQKFHEKLLEVEKEFETEKTAKPLYGIYTLLGCGRMVSVPLFWLFYIWFLMSMVYLVFSKCNEGLGACAQKAMAFSIVNTLPFVSYNKVLIEDFPKDIFFQIAGGLHTTISLVLLFMIGLALRNRFRIK